MISMDGDGAPSMHRKKKFFSTMIKRVLLVVPVFAAVLRARVLLYDLSLLVMYRYLDIYLPIQRQ